MAQFSNAINKVHGLRFIAGALEVRSAIGRQQLMKQQLMTSVKEIELHLNKVDELKNLISSGNTGKGKESSVTLTDDSKSLLDDIRYALTDVHDITGTLNALQPGAVLDDIGLFEIKKFALTTDHLEEVLQSLETKVVEFTNLSQVIALLDPDKQRVPHFYVYDAYSEELAALRKEYNEAIKQDARKAEELRLKSVETEDQIREELTNQLLAFKVAMLENLSAVADLDLWLAKAELAVSLNLCRPGISIQPSVKDDSLVHFGSKARSGGKLNDDSTGKSRYSIQYKGLFNPEVAALLGLRNKKFQPVDIRISDGPALVTGANMAGKTVLLKTVALAQYMFQYGFFVPAENADLMPVDRIMTSMEDEQSELKGLSSYASEMLKINSVIHAARNGNHILALIDEPARTTNPTEGKALVNALVDLLQEHNVKSLVTTHYSGIQSNCRRLRVAGLRTDELTARPTIETINDYMDYSLVELHPGQTDENEVPHEALRIAEILEIDKELLDRAAEYLNDSKG